MPSQPALHPRILNASPEAPKSGIRILASDIADNPYMQLALTHLAICLERAPSEGTRFATSDRQSSARLRGGLHKASENLTELIDDLSLRLAWPELIPLKKYSHYTRLHRIVLGQHQTPHHRDDASAYRLFLAILLLYVWSRSLVEPSMQRRPAFAALHLFHIEERLQSLFPEEGTPPPLISAYEFPRVHRISDMADLLRNELRIDNPADRSITTHFKVKDTPEPPPTRFICYRYATKLSDRRAKSEVTKSYLEIFPPHDKKTLYSFRHEYFDTQGIRRITDGFVVRLAQTFYFFGGSRRGEGFALGIKVIAIPASEEGTWLDRDFITGLFLSNDSNLKSIVGRGLLARARDVVSPNEHFCGRISTKDLLQDIKTNALASHAVQPSHRSQFLESLRNKGQIGSIPTVISAFVKPPA
jgi:hypothetical protein